MKIADAIKYTGRPFNIPNCPRDELPPFLKSQGLIKGAEIGVYKGAFTKKFCEAGLTIFAIDPWLAQEGQTQERQNFLYAHTQRTLSPYPNCKIMRKTSMGAVVEFANESLDFVYIDGDHKFKYVAEDLYEWFPKVKKGGIISGHDYFCTDPTTKDVPDVGPVVNAFILTFGIPNFYTFGRSKPLPKEIKDDKYLSWMFLKP